eukprot:gene9551-19851_t
MDKFPRELVNDPKPQVFVVGTVDGEPDIHQKLIQTLKEINFDGDQKDAMALEYRSIPTTYVFPDKKVPSDQICTEGILKSNWMLKHFEYLPSVIVIVTTFCVDWPAGEWIRRETITQDLLTKMKLSVSARDAKVIVVAVKTGSGSLDKEILEERANSMRRHLQLEGRSLTILGLSDFLSQSSSIKRLAKTLRELSINYYVLLSKKYKNIDKLSNKLSEVILLARYNFKTSYLYEFQGQPSRALRHYRQCHLTVIDLIKIANEELLNQILSISEWTNFKICNLLIRSGSIKEAVLQIRMHITNISNSIQMRDKFNNRLWRLNQWISDQYIIFAQLLHQYSINPVLPDCDRSFYYHNAARYTLLRLEAFNKNKLPTSLINLEIITETFPGMILVPPEYVGGSNQLIDPVLDQEQPESAEAKSMILRLSEQEENSIDKRELAINLLKQSLDSMSIRNKRRRSYIRMLIADQYILQGEYDLALSNISQYIEHLQRDRWFDSVIPLLYKKIDCNNNNNTSIDNNSDNNDDILLPTSLATSSQFIDIDTKNHMKNILTSNKYWTWTSFGSFHNKNNNIQSTNRNLNNNSNTTKEHVIPNEFTLFLSDNIPLFHIDVKMSHLSAEIGQEVTVTVSITSLLLEDDKEDKDDGDGNNGGKGEEEVLSFAEMYIHFANDILIKHFIHEDSNSNSNSNNNENDSTYQKSVNNTNNFVSDSKSTSTSTTSKCSLIFPPKTPIMFTFNIIIPEFDSYNSKSSTGSSSSSMGVTAFGRENILFVEKVLLVMKIPIETTSDSSSTAASACLVEDWKPENNHFINEEEDNDDDNMMRDTTTTTTTTSEWKDVDNQDEVVEETGVETEVDVDVEVESNWDSTVGDLATAMTMEGMDDKGSTNNLNDSKLPPGKSFIDNLGLHINTTPTTTTATATTGIANSSSDNTQTVVSRDKGTVNSSGNANGSGYRTVNWDVPAVSRDILHKQSAPSTPSTHNAKGQAHNTVVKELGALHGYAFGRDAPAVLQIRNPSSKLTLLSPQSLSSSLSSHTDADNSPTSSSSSSSSIHLLQGCIQRIDLVFTSGEDKIIDGRIFLSVDPAPASIDTAFFWYPNISNMNANTTRNGNNGGNDDAIVDNVPFHPIALNMATMQPMAPFLIPYQSKHKKFIIPIFIRSEIADNFKIKIKVEYKCRESLIHGIIRDFNLNIDILKPFAINFMLSSLTEAACGVGNGGEHGSGQEQGHGHGLLGGGGMGLGGGGNGSSFILRGDLVGVSTSVACLNSLGGELDVLELKLSPALSPDPSPAPSPAPSPNSRNSRRMTTDTIDNNSSTDSDNVNVNNSYSRKIFRILNEDDNGECDMLQNMARLLLPHPNSDSKSMSMSMSMSIPSFSVSLKRGELFVGYADVKFNDINTTTTTTKKKSTLLPATSLLDDGDYVSWLPSFEVEGNPLLQQQQQQPSSSSSSDRYLLGLDRSVTATRVCSMVFTMPSVQ